MLVENKRFSRRETVGNRDSLLDPEVCSFLLVVEGRRKRGE
jgi:hypothetical protein